MYCKVSRSRYLTTASTAIYILRQLISQNIHHIIQSHKMALSTLMTTVGSTPTLLN